MSKIEYKLGAPDMDDGHRAIEVLVDGEYRYDLPLSAAVDRMNRDQEQLDRYEHQFSLACETIVAHSETLLEIFELLKEDEQGRAIAAILFKLKDKLLLLNKARNEPSVT